MRLLSLLAALLIGVHGASAAAETPPIIAAAASLRYALDDAAAAFATDSGRSVRLTYAASGSLVQQIRAGAPYQLFLSADGAHVLALAAEQRVESEGEVYAVGRLALIAPPGSPLQVDPRLEGLRRGLADGSVRKLAIANPAVAPYGLRAQEALTHAGLWDKAERHLVYGENVGQAFQFATSGGAEGGIISLSLVKSPNFRGRHAIIPETWHKPLVQRMALVKGAGETARAFHAWLLSPRGQAVLARHGYSPPPKPPR
jgi:molybdate transport system substrate-binding protein